MADPGKSSCEKNDLTRGISGIALWCLPTCALLAGLAWASLRSWLWIPALLIMGVACLVNAARCRRVHCYFAGPIFLLAAAYVASAEIWVLPMRPGNFLGALLVLVALAYLVEMALGKYRSGA